MTWPMTNGTIGMPPGGFWNNQPITTTSYTLAHKEYMVTVLPVIPIDTTYCLTQNTSKHLPEAELISITPNPVVNTISVKTEKEIPNVYFEIYDITGKCIMQGPGNTINVETLHSGLYFIKIKTDHKEFTGKFVKE